MPEEPSQQDEQAQASKSSPPKSNKALIKLLAKYPITEPLLSLKVDGCPYAYHHEELKVIRRTLDKGGKKACRSYFYREKVLLELTKNRNIGEKLSTFKDGYNMMHVW